MSLLDRLVTAWRREQPGETLPKPSLDRRRFLQILGGSVAVAAAAPFVDLEALIWTPTPTLVVPDMGLVYTSLTAQWVADEALRMMTKTMGYIGAIDREYAGRLDDRVGQRGMTEQLTIEFEMPPVDALPIATARRRYIEPVVTPLAQAVAARGVTAFGQLPIPAGVIEAARATDPRTGLSVRVLKDYLLSPYLFAPHQPPGPVRDVMRLDLLFAGRTPAA